MNASLDELLGRFCGAVASERESLWTAGDIVNAAVDDMRRRVNGRREFRRARAALYRQFASAGHCTTTYVAQRADVSGAFGTEQRLPDVSFPFYRAVLQASRRVLDEQGRPLHTPGQLLDDALAKAWSVSDLNALGREIPETVTLSATCTACSAKTTVTAKGSTHVGIVLACPVCAAVAQREGGDRRESPHLGALEAA